MNAVNLHTQSLNWDIEADYIETALHIMTTMKQGDSLVAWRTSRGKWISETTLMQLVKDGLMNYVAPVSRNMWTSGNYVKAF